MILLMAQPELGQQVRSEKSPHGQNFGTFFKNHHKQAAKKQLILN